MIWFNGLIELIRFISLSKLIKFIGLNKLTGFDGFNPSTLINESTPTFSQSSIQLISSQLFSNHLNQPLNLVNYCLCPMHIAPIPQPVTRTSQPEYFQLPPSNFCIQIILLLSSKIYEPSGFLTLPVIFWDLLVQSSFWLLGPEIPSCCRWRKCSPVRG